MTFLGLEIGSWADWFGAVGTIVAVCVALFSVRREDKKSTQNIQLHDLTLISESLVEIKESTKDISKLRTAYENLRNDNDYFGQVEKLGNEIFDSKIRKRIEDLQLNMDLLTLSDHNIYLMERIMAFRFYYLYCLNDFIDVKNKINAEKNVKYFQDRVLESINNLNEFETKLKFCLRIVQSEIRNNKI